MDRPLDDHVKTGRLLKRISVGGASVAALVLLLTLGPTWIAASVSRAAPDQRVGRDPKLLALLRLAGRVAATDASVLITGESGTGKELVAEAIHRNSRRAAGPFVKVNLGGVSATLFESEMFGHVRGAFTDARQDRKGRFEMAHGGTIFLDEIGELDPASQVKLLRVLQDRTYEVLGSSQPRTVDVRVISAPAALQWLPTLSWPGNICQLRHWVERAVLVCAHDVLDVNDFKATAAMEPAERQRDSLPAVGTMTMDEIEKAMIVKSVKFRGVARPPHRLPRNFGTSELQNLNLRTPKPRNP